MILTVKTPENIYLNARNGAASTEAPATSYLKYGDTVDVTAVVKGTLIDGCDVWYKTADGHYYWSGGFFAPPAGFQPQNYMEKKLAFLADKTLGYLHNNTADETKWNVSWAHADLEIWRVWKDYGTKGEGVKVAIIDTGIHNDTNDLKGRVAKSLTFVNGSTLDVSPYHGTMSAGVVGAAGTTAQRIYGVAPACELYIYRAASVRFDYVSVCFAIDQAIKDGVKIISMSFTCQDNNTLKDWISYCTKNNILLVASAGDANSDQKMYPASYAGCLSTGGYYLDDSKKRVTDIAQSNHNDGVMLAAPSRDILTTSVTADPAYHQGTSAAAAFTAGVLALAASKYPNLNYTILLDALKLNTITDNIDKTTPRTDQEGYGVLNPIKLMNNLQQTRIS